jgi:hypothetical protein
VTAGEAWVRLGVIRNDLAVLLALGLLDEEDGTLRLSGRDCSPVSTSWNPAGQRGDGPPSGARPHDDPTDMSRLRQASRSQATLLV